MESEVVRRESSVVRKHVNNSFGLLTLPPEQILTFVTYYFLTFDFMKYTQSTLDKLADIRANPAMWFAMSAVFSKWLVPAGGKENCSTE